MKIDIKYAIANVAAPIVESKKIPLDARNFYRNYSSKQVPKEWFDGDVKTSPAAEYSTVVPEKEQKVWYEFKGLKNVVVNKVRIFDYQGIITGNPLHVYGVDEYYQKVLLCVFDGKSYNGWREYTFDSQKVKYLLLTGAGKAAGATSTEFEIYGTYEVDPIKILNITRKPIFRNLCGANIYEWNIFSGASTAGASTISEEKLALMAKLGTVRHYLDWNRIQGSSTPKYRFEPEGGGSWFLDKMYKALKEKGVEIVTCLQGTLKDIVDTYPEGQRSHENSPLRYGAEKDDPNSYAEQARMLYQLAGRYASKITIEVVGEVKAITDLPKEGSEGKGYILLDKSGIKQALYSWFDSTKSWVEVMNVNTSQRWTHDVQNELKLALGYVRYLEVGNENNRNWKGRKAYQTGREHAANLSAAYDGHMGKMGPGIGVKNIAPDVKLTTCGTAGIDTKYFQGIIDWSKEHRGFREDGKVNVPFDVINFHTYRNDGGSEQHQGKRTRGSAPEVTNMYESLLEVRNILLEYFGDSVELVLGEIGYDENQSSIQKAISIGDKGFHIVKADWLLRSSLECGRAGIHYMHIYQLFDDDTTGASTTQYLTSGIANKELTPRTILHYMNQATSFMGDFQFNENISMQPRVDKWSLKNEDVYIVWSPTEDGSKGVYKLEVADVHTEAVLYTLNTDKSIPVESKLTIAKSYDINYSETPTFIKITKK